MPSYKDLQIIHILKRELSLTDEAYRDIMRERVGKESAKHLTPGQAFQLIEHFRSLERKQKRSKKNRPIPKYPDAHMRKVVAIWTTMTEAKVIINGYDAAFQKYVKRMTGVNNLKWCDTQDLNHLIEILKQWAAREGVELA